MRRRGLWLSCIKVLALNLREALQLTADLVLKTNSTAGMESIIGADGKGRRWSQQNRIVYRKWAWLGVTWGGVVNYLLIFR